MVAPTCRRRLVVVELLLPELLLLSIKWWELCVCTLLEFCDNDLLGRLLFSSCLQLIGAAV